MLLEGQAAFFGLPAAPPKATKEPGELLELARMIKEAPASGKLKNNPELKAIFEELLWRNQTIISQRDAILARCLEAQRLPAEPYKEKDSEGHGSWLLFPVKDLNNRVGRDEDNTCACVSLRSINLFRRGRAGLDGHFAHSPLTVTRSSPGKNRKGTTLSIRSAYPVSCT